MKREILIVGAFSAALAGAAFVRPPRALPAFTQVAASKESSAACLFCHGEPIVSARYRSLRSGQATSNHRGHHARGQRAHSHEKGATRTRYRKHIELVDVNHADAATLARVPGITEDLARRIVAFRGLVGPFATLDDL
ncbi:MAG: helix-hairpin-helix domain-containing protein, partial [Vulcanimicrobiaceae bacterium]